MDTRGGGDPRYMGDYGGPNGDELREIDSLIAMLNAREGTPTWWRISDWALVKRALPLLRDKVASEN